ncbi:MAG: 2-amino-4-hydroxy-6-hydroxymethyldihydropteridine diphosphokinase [Bacteroidia bacterium]
MGKATLLLGTNLGDRMANIRQAEQRIARQAGQIVLQSSVYETAAWGYRNQPSFLNQVLVVETSLPPQELMKELLLIEKQMGRSRTTRWRERSIDIDILFYDDLVLNEAHLVIPHPHLHERNFTLVPLREVMPGYLHPVLKKTVSQLVDESRDKLAAEIYQP